MADPITAAELSKAALDAATAGEFVSSTSLTTPDQGTPSNPDIRTIAGMNKAGDDAIAAISNVSIGLYLSDPTFNNRNEYVNFDRSGTNETYRLRDTTPTPYPVNSGATPDPLNDVNLQPFTDNSFVTENAILHDNLAGAKSRTDVAEGSQIEISDLGEGKFQYVTGETPDGFRIIAHDTLSIQLKLIIVTYANVKWFGALGNGVADDVLPIQAAIDYVESMAGGTVIFPSGTYNITSELLNDAGNGVFLIGVGRSSIISNTTSGNTLVFGDGVTQTADCGIMDLMLINTNDNMSALYTKKRTNFNVLTCVISSSGTGGYGIRSEASFDSKVTNTTIQGIRGWGIHIDTDGAGGSNAMSISATRMDGNIAFRSIGVQIQNTAKVTIDSSSAIQGFGACGVISGTQVKNLSIKDTYFEDNGTLGYNFTGGTELREIKADIILNGGTLPALGNAQPTRACSVDDCYFNPLSSTQDCSIYLVATEGFSEKGNNVTQAYNVATASFIRSRNKSSIYANNDSTFGNSFVFNYPTDKYYYEENLNDAALNQFDDSGITTLAMDAKYAPRVDLHKNLSPASYDLISASTTTLSAEIAKIRYKGRQSFEVTRAAIGSSGFYGALIKETDNEDFWGGEQFVFYAEVKASLNTPGFELFVDVDGERVTSGGGDATSLSQWQSRVVLFRAVAGQTVNVGYRMTGGTGADKVIITRPVLTPHGAVSEIAYEDIAAALEFSAADDTPSVKDGNVFRKTDTGVLNNFDDGQVGDVIMILAENSFTVADSSNVNLSGSVNFAMTSNDTLTLTMFIDGLWHETGRSIN